MQLDHRPLSIMVTMARADAVASSSLKLHIFTTTLLLHYIFVLLCYFFSFITETCMTEIHSSVRKGSSRIGLSAVDLETITDHKRCDYPRKRKWKCFWSCCLHSSWCKFKKCTTGTVWGHTVSSHMTKQLDGIFIVAGNFNQTVLITVLPKFRQHVHTTTRGSNTLDHVYTNIPSATKPSPVPILVNQTIFPCFSCLLTLSLLKGSNHQKNNI